MSPVSGNLKDAKDCIKKNQIRNKFFNTDLRNDLAMIILMIILTRLFALYNIRMLLVHQS